LTWLDFAVLMIICLGTINGVRRGFVRSLFGLLGLVVGVAAGWAWAPAVAEFMENRWAWGATMTDYLAETVPFPRQVGGVISPGASYSEFAELVLLVLGFLFVFVLVTLAARFVAKVIHAAVGWGFTGALDHMMGGVFSFMASALFISVLLGVLLMASASYPALHGMDALVYGSPLAQELVRVFYVLSPLSERLLEVVS